MSPSPRPPRRTDIILQNERRPHLPGLEDGAVYYYNYFFQLCRRVQHFLFVSPKRKRWQKKKAPGRISNFPPDPLKATRKTTLVFLDLSCTVYRPGGTNDMHCTREHPGRPMCRPVVRTQANPYNLSSFIGSRLPHRLKRSY